jgi:triosephosphate isomerase
MRTPFIAGNWKMNKTVAEAQALAAELAAGLASGTKADVAICPPAVSLSAVKAALGASPIKVGAQNMHYEAKGAFTGEIAPGMLAGLADYVIIGHSERRQMFGETDMSVNRKVSAAFSNGLTPIMCVGETLAENEAGQTEAVLSRQIKEGLVAVSAADAPKLVVAYEPIWAIGTGRAATPDDAQRRCWFIRNELRELFGAGADLIRIQYGGSVTPANAAEILSKPDIDGALVGGASLKCDEFATLAAIAAGGPFV